METQHPLATGASVLTEQTPTRSPEDAEQAEAHEPSQAPAAPDERPPSADGAGEESTVKKILLVDDDHINLRVLSVYMGKLGRAYETAMNGQEAIDAYVQGPERFAGILMDISMPAMDGLEATRKIRAFEHQSRCEPVVILALTGLATDDARQEAERSGVDVFLTKPVKLGLLYMIFGFKKRPAWPIAGPCYLTSQALEENIKPRIHLDYTAL
jgi:CheY-like chemotaxis protein